MSVDKQHGRILISCDTCDEVFEADRNERQFIDVWTRAKEDGWKAINIGDVDHPEFEHYCGRCAK